MNRPAPQAFGSWTRATDGMIVTFELPNGDLWVEHFTQPIGQGPVKDGVRGKTTRQGISPVEQAAARADVLDAKIVTLSSPQTILTDLQGTRAILDGKPTGTPGIQGGRQQGPANFVAFPEIQMLSKIGRSDLLKAQQTGAQAKHNIRQIRQRRASTAGRRNQ